MERQKIEILLKACRPDTLIPRSRYAYLTKQMLQRLPRPERPRRNPHENPHKPGLHDRERYRPHSPTLLDWQPLILKQRLQITPRNLIPPALPKHIMQTRRFRTNNRMFQHPEPQSFIRLDLLMIPSLPKRRRVRQRKALVLRPEPHELLHERRIRVHRIPQQSIPPSETDVVLDIPRPDVQQRVIDDHHALVILMRRLCVSCLEDTSWR